MKKILLITASILMVASCHVEEQRDFVDESQLNPNRIKTFYASLEGGSSDTKVYADENLKVLWNEGDYITVFNQYTYNSKFQFNGEDGDNAGGFDEVPYAGFVSGNVLSNVYAVYPYMSGTKINNAGTTITMTLPDEQNYKEHSFGIGANAMVAVTDNNFLAFKNVGGYLSLRLYGDNVSVSRITIQGNNHEKIAGKANIAVGLDSLPKVTMDETATESVSIVCDSPVPLGDSSDNYTDFWFVLPPTTFANGFTVTVTDALGGTFTKSTSNSITIPRNSLERMHAIQVLDFLPGSEAEKAAERSALISIYNALNGDNWSNKTNWCTEARVGTWEGVTTDDEGYVVALSLWDSNLNGSFPEEICQLSHLQRLQLVGNVTGIIPSSIGNLSNLLSLYIQSENLSGSLPKSICEITGLQELTVGGLGGVLPEEIGNLTNLTTLSLFPFYGDGPLPDSFAKLINLTTLMISDANFNQPFPECILNMSHLQFLSLVRCGLSGQIPSGIGNLTDMRFLNLPGNSLSGPIPNSFGQLNNLISLNLDDNAFTEFPSSISQCDALQTVYLSGNQSEMLFNNDIWLAPSLQYLNLRNSNITGSLSAAVGFATKLQELDISRNHFSGTLPPEMSGMTSLRSLIINNNEFTGSIPDSFSALSGLETFILFNNYMSGPIAEDVVLLDVFSKWMLNPQYNDGIFTYSLYESTSFTGNKTVTMLREATVGNGINIVLMGDAYTDKDIADGTYDYAMNLACDALFEVEPFKSYENRFNVYAISLVSRNGHVVGDTALGIDYEPALGSAGYSGYGSSLDIVNEVIPDLDVEQLTIGIIVNNLHSAGACSAYQWGTSSTPYGSGCSISVIPNKYVDGSEGIHDFVYTVIHEVVGHGFGKLGDEYATYEGHISDQQSGFVTEIQQEHGWVMNVSVTNDPNQVPWKAFLALPAYVNDGITLIEGGYNCTFGVWRPTNSSIMSCDYRIYPFFNAPSREAIYRRIHLISDGSEWTYDFDDFVQWDAKNLQNP